MRNHKGCVGRLEKQSVLIGAQDVRLGDRTRGQRLAGSKQITKGLVHQDHDPGLYLGEDWGPREGFKLGCDMSALAFK